MGVCLYIFTTGLVPFFSLSPADLFDLIKKANVQYEGLGLSNELKNLLAEMLNSDPSKRPGVRECLKHDFCADARVERIGHHSNASQHDADMALSATVPQGPEAPCQTPKRDSDLTAPGTAPASTQDAKNRKQSRRRAVPDQILREKSRKFMTNLKHFRF